MKAALGPAIERKVNDSLRETTVSRSRTLEWPASNRVLRTRRHHRRRAVSSRRAEVWLVRTSDGAELFRRYAPTYSRAVVALSAGRYFAVDDVQDRRSSVRVYDLTSPH